MVQPPRTTYRLHLSVGYEGTVTAQDLCALPCADTETADGANPPGAAQPTIYIVTAGSGFITVDERRFAVKTGSVVIAPMLSVRSVERQGPLGGTVVSVSDDMLMYLVSKGLAHRNLFAQSALITLPRPALKTMEAAAAAIAEESAATRPFSLLAKTGHFQVLLATLLRHAPLPDRLAESSAIRVRHGQAAFVVFRFRGLVEEHYRERWNLGQYAAALGTTEGRLRSASLKMLGIQPGAMITDRIVKEASRLLAFSVMSITEIAFYLGFSEQAHFTRFFRQKCGVPPSEYRRRTAEFEKGVLVEAPAGPYLAEGPLAAG